MDRGVSELKIKVVKISIVPLVSQLIKLNYNTEEYNESF